VSGRGFRWTLPVAVVLGAVLLYLAVRGVKWSDLVTAVRQARIEFLLFAVGFSHIALFLRSLRWRVLLSAEKRVAPLTVFWATMAGYLGNNFLPARAGEFIRSAALGHKAGLSKSWVFATALTERLLDVVALVLFSFVAVLSMGHSSQWLVRAWRLMGIVGAAGIAFLLLMPKIEAPLLRTVARLRLPDRLRERLAGILSQFISGLRSLANPGRGLGFAGLTVAIWLTDAVGTVVGARAFGLSVPLPLALVLLAGLGLSSAIPSTPGYVGVYQFVAVAVLVPFGLPRTGVLAYITTVQALGYAVITLWGLIGLWRLQVRPADAARAGSS
jgi:uncharacterized protein (TIRG00374 family)